MVGRLRAWGYITPSLCTSVVKRIRVKFQQEANGLNFSRTDSLSYMRAQLKVFAGGVCLRSCFREEIFSLEGDTLKNWHSKGIYSFALKFGQELAQHVRHRICDFFISKYSCTLSNFFAIAPFYFYAISKRFCNFPLQLNITKRRRFFSALVPKKKKILNQRQTKFAVTYSFRKAIRTIAVKSRQKNNRKFSLIASFISFNLI